MFITLLFSLGCAGLGAAILRRLLVEMDDALRLGLAGLVGLGMVGLLTLFVGLVPGGLVWGVYSIGVLVFFGLVWLCFRERPGRPRIHAFYEWAFVAALLACVSMGALAALAPSGASDWDTISHHLASTKIWLGQGTITYIPFMHQSNFPFSLDNLFIWGQVWGGQTGAKTFTVAIYLFGILAIFGAARQSFGRGPAWWSAMLFAAAPVVIGQAGTGYIDVGHGLFAGLGIVFAIRAATSGARNDLWLAAILLGFAAGTKYTGLQAILVAGLGMVLVGRPIAPSFVKAAVVGAIALAIASPWYVKNALWTGNPVYPFFYGALDGKDWDSKRAEIYTNEQRTFGVGRGQLEGTPSASVDPAQLGHGIFGLAYQPGRYVNPGQTAGMGEPLGAVGAAVLVTLVSLAGRGRRSGLETGVLASVGLFLLAWFVLSQQSRYITTIIPPIAILAAGILSWTPVRLLLPAVIAGQAAWSLWLMKTRRVDDAVSVVFGSTSREDFLTRRVPSYPAALYLNALGKGTKVALYDEVFGYYLDVPYVWANPGHGKLIPYESINTGAELSAELRRQGFTHAYVAGQVEEGFPYAPMTTDERAVAFTNWEIKWKALLSDAMESGDIAVERVFPGRGVLFRTRSPGNL